MKLNVFEEIVGTGKTISQEVGITKQRERELMEMMFYLHKEIHNSLSPISLTPYYKRIAEACNSLEEYTMCLHLFIFYLARHGLLKTENEDYEKNINATTNN